MEFYLIIQLIIFIMTIINIVLLRIINKYINKLRDLIVREHEININNISNVYKEIDKIKKGKINE